MITHLLRSVMDRRRNMNNKTINLVGTLEEDHLFYTRYYD